MGKLRMSTSGGTRPRCLCRWGCWIRGGCRWSGSNRPSSCCASHKDIKMSRQLRRNRVERSLRDENLEEKSLYEQHHFVGGGQSHHPPKHQRGPRKRKLRCFRRAFC